MFCQHFIENVCTQGGKAKRRKRLEDLLELAVFHSPVGTISIDLAKGLSRFWRGSSLGGVSLNVFWAGVGPELHSGPIPAQTFLVV